MMAAVLGSASLMAQEVDSISTESAQTSETIQPVEYLAGDPAPFYYQQRNSLSISAGYVSGFFFSKLIIAWIGPAASHARKTDYYGSYGLQYHYQVNSWCRVGAKFNWEGEDYDMWTGKKDDETAVKKGVTFGHTLSLVASAQFTYFNREHVQIYSGLDAGVGTYISDVKYLPGYEDSDGNTHPVNATWLPAFNITPIGVAFGSWRVFGFVETNIGYEAFAKAGLGVHF